MFKHLQQICYTLKYVSTTDYSWREYQGKIPLDALVVVSGGCDASIYIAQGFFVNAGILPAGLYSNIPEIVATAQGRLFKTSKHLKVLCTPHPHLFRWVQTTATTLENLKTKCELVYGGIETDMTQYIGRKVQDGKMMIGKIYRIEDNTSVLTLPANNPVNEIRYTEYEVLTYNCQEGCNAILPWK